LNDKVRGGNAGLAGEELPQGCPRGNKSLAVILEFVTRGALALRNTQDFTRPGTVEPFCVEVKDLYRGANTSVPLPR
jgi:hypothetical protein